MLSPLSKERSVSQCVSHVIPRLTSNTVRGEDAEVLPPRSPRRSAAYLPCRHDDVCYCGSLVHLQQGQRDVMGNTLSAYNICSKRHYVKYEMQIYSKDDRSATRPGLSTQHDVWKGALPERQPYDPGDVP